MYSIYIKACKSYTAKAYKIKVLIEFLSLQTFNIYFIRAVGYIFYLYKFIMLYESYFGWARAHVKWNYIIKPVAWQFARIYVIFIFMYSHNTHILPTTINFNKNVTLHFVCVCELIRRYNIHTIIIGSYLPKLGHFDFVFHECYII